MSKSPSNKTERAHRFKVGQTVALAPGFGYSRNDQAVYKVVALLPSNGAHYQYRLKNQSELFERVAAENELMLRRDYY